MNLKDKIEKLYKDNSDCQDLGIPVKNVEVLITNMIKEHYEWEEITAVIRILRKGKGKDLINIIRDTIS